MNKKTTCLLCLSAGLLLGVAVAVPSTLLSTGAFGDAPVAVATKSIAVSEKDGVTVSVPSEAAVGSVVDVRLELDDSKIISVDDVLVNGLRASKVAPTHFQFVMPDADVSLSLSVTEAVKVVGNPILAATADWVILEGLPEFALPDTEVSFVISFAAYAGYTWDGTVDVKAVGEESSVDVETTINGSEVSFTMPDAPVTIDVGTQARHYLITKAYEEEAGRESLAVIGNIEAIPANDDAAKPIIDSSIYSLRGRAATGEKIRVNLVSSNTLNPRGIYLAEFDQEILLEEDKTYVEFDMPGQNVTIFPLVETRFYDVNLFDSEHVNLELYHKVVDEETGEASYVADNAGNKLRYLETGYIKATPTSNNYGLSKLKLVQASASNPSYTDTFLEINEDGYFAFTNGYSVLSSTVTAIEAAAFSLDNIAFVYDENNHLAGYLCVQDGDMLVLVDENHPVIPGAKVYVRATSDDPDFGLGLVSGTYTAGEEENASLVLTKVYSGLAKGFYAFEIPVEATAVSLSLSQQKVYTPLGIVGDYTAKYLSVTGSTLLGDNTYMNELNPAGIFSTNYNTNYAITSVTPKEEGASYGTFEAVSGRRSGSILPETNADFDLSGEKYRFGYSEELVFWAGTSPLAAASNESPVKEGLSTVYVAFHNDPEEDEELTISAAKFEAEGETIGVILAAYEDSYYAGFLYNYTTGAAIYGDELSIELTAGERLDSDDAIFNINVNGATRYSLGTVNGEKIALDGYQGTYAIEGDDNTLTLDGIGHATYGEKNGTYALGIEGVTLTIKEYGDDGLTVTTIKFALDPETHTGTKGEESAVGPSVSETALQTEFIAISGRNNRFGFTDNGNGTYSSGNKGQSNSVAEMSFFAYKRMMLSFDYSASGEKSYDYMSVCLNGEIVDGFDKIGDTVPVTGTFSQVLEAGDVVSVIYTKDSSSNKGDDEVVLSNVVFAQGLTAGEYAIEGDEMPVILDGFGHATYGNAALTYVVPANESEGTIVIVMKESSSEGNTQTTTTTTFTLDIATKTGVKNVESSSQTIGTPTITYSDTYPFSYNSEGYYVNGNTAANNSTSYIQFSFDQAGVFSFDYYSEGEGCADYATIYVNGTAVRTGKAASGYDLTVFEGHFEVEVNAGDTVKVDFVKDSSAAKGIDGITLSNVLYVINN